MIETITTNFDRTFLSKKSFLREMAWQITEEKFGNKGDHYDNKGFFKGKALLFYKKRYKEIEDLSENIDF
jgi:hypothetical protein